MKVTHRHHHKDSRHKSVYPRVEPQWEILQRNKRNHSGSKAWDIHKAPLSPSWTGHSPHRCCAVWVYAADPWWDGWRLEHPQHSQSWWGGRWYRSNRSRQECPTGRAEPQPHVGSSEPPPRVTTDSAHPWLRTPEQCPPFFSPSSPCSPSVLLPKHRSWGSRQRWWCLHQERSSFLLLGQCQPSWIAN